MDLPAYIKQILDEAKSKYVTDGRRPEVGWTCTYLPVEILETANVKPVRIVPEPEAEKADAFLDPNFCPYVRASLGKAIEGGYRDLAGVIILNTCDGMRRLYDAWRYYASPSFAFFLDVPKLVTPEAVNYFREQLEKLTRELQKHFEVEITEKSLLNAVSQMNRTRELYTSLILAHSKGLCSLSYGDFLTLFQREYEMPRGVFNYVLERIVKESNKPSEADPERARVFVTGSILDGEAIIRLVEELGGKIVGLDCCLAERRPDGVSIGKDMLHELSESYLEKVPCARMKDTRTRVEYLIQGLERRGAQGLIYTSLKFCDPYLYEFPYIKEELENKGIPVLFLEGEYRGRPSGGIRTRVQAFLEMLEKRKS